jgi:23S rRNA pseudouridine2605 synthase
MDKSDIDKKEEQIYPISLSKYLSICGVASRRKSTELIKSGAVKINGISVCEPGLKIQASDKVVHKEKLVSFEKRHYVMLNKPRGYVCTSDDPFAKKKAIDLVKIPGARLFTAGRLDKDSEGLIIITNDGDYATQLTHPRFQTQKRYRVTVDATLTSEMIEQFCKGVEDEGEILTAKSVTKESDFTYLFTLTEGKNREIRRMVSWAKRKTVRLKRIATGKLSLQNLQPGKWRNLTEEEISLSLGK